MVTPTSIAEQLERCVALISRAPLAPDGWDQALLAVSDIAGAARRLRELKG
jgi:hypothetical protein